MPYNISGGYGTAVFYYGKADFIGRAGEVKTENGEITEYRLDNDSEFLDFSEEKMESENISHITFHIPVTYIKG